MQKRMFKTYAVYMIANTRFKLRYRRENIQGKDEANQAHFDVGAKVKQTIKELGATMPEGLPHA